MSHPDYFLSQPPEMGLSNPDNIHILISHLQCATFELPFGSDERFGGLDVAEILDFLRERGFIHRAGRKWHWMSDSYPADSTSLRSIGSDNFVVVETTGEHRIIGEVDYASTFSTVHEKAIYLHQGQQYYVHQLDISERRAYVRQADSDYFTDAITYTKVRILETMETHAEHQHGFSRALFEIREQVLSAARRLINSCSCEDGCPSCVGPTILAKEVALAILDSLNHV